MLKHFIGEYLGAARRGDGASSSGAVFARHRRDPVGLLHALALPTHLLTGARRTTVAAHVYDMNPREWAAMVPLIVLMVWMGTFTQSFFPSISPVNERYVVEQARSAQESPAKLAQSKGTANAR